jgi:AraC family carnitine catabolism transcriptional activator
MEQSLSVALIVAPNFSFLSLAIWLDGLRVANRESGLTAFDWIIVGEDREPVVSSSGPAVTPGAALRELAGADVSIVLTAYEPAVACTPALLNWLRRQDRAGRIIGCVDTGALVLGRAGLLRGARIAAHREVVAPFHEEISDAELLDDPFLFEGRLLSSALDDPFLFEGRLLSSAGGFATMEMVLALIERTNGAALAAQVATAMNHAGAPPRDSSNGGIPADNLTAKDRRLSRLVSFMQSDLEAPLAIAEICRRAHVEASTARRLFLRHLGKTPSAYYLGLRLERAATLLRYSHLGVAEIAAAVGFADTPSFSHAFKRIYGLPPSRARRDITGRWD